MNTFRAILRVALVTSLMAPLASSALAAPTIDTTLLSPTTTTPAPDFAMHTFASCDDMKEKIADFMELYYLKYPPYSWGGGMPYYDGVVMPTLKAPET